MDLYEIQELIVKGYIRTTVFLFTLVGKEALQNRLDTPNLFLF